MDSTFFQEIANEIKGLHNQAARLIQEKKLSEADALYKRALKTTSMLNYHDGMAVCFYNMANLEILRENHVDAITYASLSKEMHEKASTDSDRTDELLKHLAKAAMSKGMKLEKEGALQEATEHYYACMPFAEEKYRMAMIQEIKLIKKVMTNG